MVTYNHPQAEFLRLQKEATFPATRYPYNHLYSIFSGIEYNLEPNRSHIVPTHIRVKPPYNYEFQLRPAGLAQKGILLLDAGKSIFEEELTVHLFNLSSEVLKITQETILGFLAVQPIYSVLAEFRSLPEAQD